MPHVRTTKQLDHRWIDLFALVLDLKDYPNFVPHCRAVKLIRRCTDAAGRTIIVSRMSVGVSALQLSYANRTTADPAARRIEVEALDGPLRRLAVVWRFEPLEEERTRVDFAADYAFDSPILAALASELFNSMLREIMNAFEQRADRLLAPRRREARRLAAHEPGLFRCQS
jgi:coenzyme Q-binding protein COQ10